ncbi:MAG: hypothetical protein WDZ63_02945 [Burkholderiales bacterium]
MSGLGMFPLIVVAAALGAGLLVFMLYLLRPPARRLLIPSGLIWDRVLRAGRRSDDRLRWLLSLLLAAAIAALIAVAAVGPALPDASGNDRVLVIVDNSPTMATRTSGGDTRFDRARQLVLELLDGAGPGVRVMLADTMRQIEIPAFEPREAALKRLRGLEVSFGQRPDIPAPALAAAAGARYVVTDGVQLRDLPAELNVLSVFEPVENVGITAFAIEAVPGAPHRYEAFLEIGNAGSSPRDVTLTLAGVGAERVEREVAVPARSSSRELIDVSAFDGGPVRASLMMSGDGLSVDDSAYGFLPMRRTVRTILVTRSNPYLEKSLAAQPRMRLTVIPPDQYADRGNADLYVFDRYAPDAAPLAPALLVRPGSAAWLPDQGAEIAEPAVASWDGAHPLLENISLRDLYVEKAAPVRGQADNLHTLVASRGGTSLMVTGQSARRWVSLAFALEDSNFALDAGFPVFLNNVINWMVGEPDVRAEALGMVYLPRTAARVIGVDGADVNTVSVAGELRFRAVQPGIYTVVAPGARTRIAVSLLDTYVTDVNASSLPETTAAVAQVSLPGRVLDPWVLLLSVALLLLGIEWLTYNRRVTV